MASETGNQAEPHEDPEVLPSAILALQVPGEKHLGCVTASSQRHLGLEVRSQTPLQP